MYFSVVLVAESMASRHVLNVEGQSATLDLYYPTEAVSDKQQDVMGDSMVMHSSITSETNTIRVAGLDENTDTSILKICFESRDSGGGPIASIQHDTAGGTALISFVEKEGTHTLA